MSAGRPDDDEPKTLHDRSTLPPVTSLHSCATYHGDASTLGTGFMRHVDPNVSGLRNHVSGIFERSLLNTPQPSDRAQGNDWSRPPIGTNPWPAFDGRFATPSGQNVGSVPPSRSAPTTDNDMDRSHLGSDEESGGGEPIEGDEDDTRRGSFGGDDTTITPHEGNMDGESTMTTENRRKRQSLRRGTACVRCRTKKLKCTGERPTCSVCANSKKPAACVYEEPPKKVPKIQRRQTRLQQIEAQIEERTQELKALETARVNAVAFVAPIAEFPGGNMPQAMPMATRTLLSFGDQPFPPESSSVRGHNVPMVHGSRSSLHPAATPPRQSGSCPPVEGTYPGSNDVTQVPSPFEHQPFHGQAYEGFMSQQSYVAELPPIASGSRHGRTAPYAREPTSPHAPLTSFLAETAGLKQQGGTAHNSEIPAYIMSKYGNDVMKAVEFTTFLSSRGLTFTGGQVDVAMGSQMEYALLYLVLPYIERLCFSLDPRRFLDSLVLPAASRPRPALLYILFAEASRVISKGMPLPHGSKSIPESFSKPDVSLLQHAKDLEEPFFQRSQTMLREGLEQLDRPLDLVKASVISCRYLISYGRYVDAWLSPCLRLAVACGLHKITSPVAIAPISERKPSANSGSTMGLRDSDSLPTDYGRMHDQERRFGPSGSSWQIGQTPSQTKRSNNHQRSQVSKPVLIPPPADDIEVWERIELFWAVKEMDWGMSSHFSWTSAIPDEEIQTPWPQARTDYERGTVKARMLGGIGELLQPRSGIMVVPPRSPRVLALKSLCLLNRASRLSDLPHPPAVLHSHQREPLQPGYTRMPLPRTAQALADLQTALEAFKSYDMPSVNQIPASWAPNQWWICARANLAAAEMFFFREYAIYKPMLHENAVASARRIVDLVKSLSDETYANLHVWVPFNIVAIANFLSQEAQRLRSFEQPEVQQAALVAEQDLSLLQRVLSVDIGKWQDLAKLQFMTHQRFRDGLQERLGQYERAP